ncbi:MurR/RpiR family transcriptional regulator [Dielma fastidiosa]|uniref:SIS domain-containing protein n=2 Tax=Dielma fastidiosa TaxID=1034346 RepID=A0A318KG10_9FIRM|nr:SIS domain-containing protein [Dielma fastidiosa]PXX73688.1 SIS domain-containing protein [Dielma fastidiosa]
MLNAENIVFLGVQFSGIAAYDAHLRFSRIGMQSKFFITESDILTYAYFAKPKDVVFFISYSGQTAVILEAAEYVKRKDAYMVSITKNHNNELLEYCDQHLYINSSDDPENNLSLSSRIATLSLIDTIYGILINKKSDSIYERLMQTNKIYKKHFGS